MSEGQDVTGLVAECERYWQAAGIPPAAVAEMSLELRQHLEAAVADGRSVESVVGDDPTAFAAAWAAEYRDAPEDAPSSPPAPTTSERTSGGMVVTAYLVGALALVLAVVAIAREGAAEVNDPMWRWLWTGLALVMGIGEIFTAGFFLLPFAIGAGVAALLAWLGVGVLAQWLAFFGVSVIALAYLRRYISAQDDAEVPRVGANRWVGAEGVVLEEIDPLAARGLVRVEGEEWRATTEGERLPAGTLVVVTEVRGARLVVRPQRVR